MTLWGNRTGMLSEPHVAWLDATLGLPELARLAAARIRRETGQEIIRGAV